MNSVVTHSASFLPGSFPEGLSSSEPVIPAFLFAGREFSVIADDFERAVAGSLEGSRALHEAVEEAFRERGPNSYLAGAIPFSRSEAGALFVGSRVRRGEVWVPEICETIPRLRAGRNDEYVEKREFCEAVRSVARAIDEGILEKVVLSRAVDYLLGESPRLWPILARLRRDNPSGVTFALRLPDKVEETFLIGASPELLVRRRGTLFVTCPLAGSIRKGASPAENTRRGAELLQSNKDRHEHAIVVDGIIATLRPHARELRWESVPEVVETATMLHLGTRIEGTLLDPSLNALDLVAILHPTSAVCGTPSALAREWISRVEKFERGYFSGALGYMDERGDGDWIVTLRCAEVSASRVRAYAGAGIVGASIPESELQETEAKMATILKAIGIGDAE